jgi:hypothetical protein
MRWIGNNEMDMDFYVYKTVANKKKEKSFGGIKKKM